MHDSTFNDEILELLTEIELIVIEEAKKCNHMAVTVNIIAKMIKELSSIYGINALCNLCHGVNYVNDELKKLAISGINLCKKIKLLRGFTSIDVVNVTNNFILHEMYELSTKISEHETKYETLQIYLTTIYCDMLLKFNENQRNLLTSVQTWNITELSDRLSTIQISIDEAEETNIKNVFLRTRGNSIGFIDEEGNKVEIYDECGNKLVINSEANSSDEDDESDNSDDSEDIELNFNTIILTLKSTLDDYEDENDESDESEFNFDTVFENCKSVCLDAFHKIHTRNEILKIARTLNKFNESVKKAKFVENEKNNTYKCVIDISEDLIDHIKVSLSEGNSSLRNLLAKFQLTNPEYTEPFIEQCETSTISIIAGNFTGMNSIEVPRFCLLNTTVAKFSKNKLTITIDKLPR